MNKEKFLNKKKILNKKKFLKKLNYQLHPLRPSERKRYIQDYEELLAELMEEGKTEEEAVLKLGDAEQIAQNILEYSEKRFEWIDWKGKGLLVLSFLSAAAALISNRISQGAAICLNGGDGSTSVFVAGKIPANQWIYILTGTLIGVTGIYLFWKQKVR